MLAKAVKTRIYAHTNCTHTNTYIYRNITLKWLIRMKISDTPF